MSGNDTSVITKPVPDTGDRAIQVYTRAISLYLDAVYKKEQLAPDTLYVGRNDDFPALVLPPVIGRSNIVLISPGEVGNRQYREGFVFINAPAWIDANGAQVLIVTFRDGFHPQHNCNIYLSFNETAHSCDLDTLYFDYPYGKTRE